jgi:peptidoglycan/LPS O-acetylase OafA/YrhL
MNTTITPRPHYPALDGLRGIAVLLVVIHHNFDTGGYFFFGWLGVDLFFVLSGFLITDILLRTVNEPGYLKNFYMRRVLRIFPLYYLALFIILVIFPLFDNLGLELGFYTENQVWLWTYTQNWLYIFKTQYGSPILLHFWSLAVEEQFYIIWPFLILWIRKPKPLLVFVFILLLGVNATRLTLWFMQIPDFAYANFHLFTRVDGICAGAMLALLFRINISFLRHKIWMIILILACLNFLFYFISDSFSPRLPFLAFVGFTTFAVVFAYITYEAILGETKLITIICTSRILKFFGKISYGLYVYHWPVYIILFSKLNKILTVQLNSVVAANITSSLLVTLAAILLSVISYRYFESFFLNLKKRFA